MKTPFQPSPDSKRAKTGHDDGGDDALLAECHQKLEGIGAHYTSTHFFVTALPYFLMVVQYAQWCLRQMIPGEVYIILQGKCPVSMMTADGRSISLALGGNCPKEKRWSICTVRCADQLFGNLLKRFFFFNCRVQCRKDPKTGRCEICSLWEAEALGRIYEVLCMYAHGIGAVMRYISVAGSSTGIEKTLYNWYLKDKHHSDGSPYIEDGMFLPNGYHLSLLAYFCDKFESLEVQVRSFITFCT